MAKKRVLFGGTFDPIHLGHINTVTQACREVEADELILLPCHIPPHKQHPKVTSADRLNMVSAVAAELDASLPFKVTCSDHEILRGGQSYTRLTVEHFQQLDPSATLFFFIGMDSYLTFTSWYHWQEILDFCQLLVAKRPGYPVPETDIEVKLQQCSRILELEQFPISSSELRTSPNLMQQWLPTSVFQYIVEHELYQK